MKLTILILLLPIVILSILKLSVNNKYTTEIENYWELADRSSTIQSKSQYINQFVNALESNEHSDYGALLFKNPENNWENNLMALKSLQQRLEELKDMDINSFAYQTAIQQITEQEQGEANAMLQVFCDAWMIKYNIFMYSVIFALTIILLTIGLLVGIGYIIEGNY